MHAHSVMLKPELSSIHKTGLHYYLPMLCILYKSREQRDYLVVTSKIMWERVYPCRGITHSTGGEMRNLIVWGEDLLLGDHGQSNQTLGRGIREMRGESHESLGWELHDWHWNNTWRKGQDHGPFLSFHFLLSTVLPYPYFFADSKVGGYFGAVLMTLKWTRLHAKKRKNMLKLFLIYLCNERDKQAAKQAASLASLSCFLIISFFKSKSSLKRGD